VVGIVDRLEEKGLVKRERGSRDRRQVQIALTAAGADLIAQAPSPLQQTLAAGLRQLPELEQVSITLALETLVELMNARSIDAAPLLETGPLHSPRRKPPHP
jgi:DNA-binding MarR family transcriptional regulator